MIKNTLGSRIRSIREQHGLNQDEFAKLIGVVRSSISTYEKDANLPNANVLAEICTKFHISTQWLLLGIGDPISDNETPSVKNNQTILGALKEVIANDDDILMVPMVEAVMSAGSGSFETSDYSERKYAFRRDFLCRKGNSSQMVLMRVAGDSMEPSIEDGDVVLIDQSQRTPAPNRIYAVGVEDMVYLKRINSRPGKIILSSDNPDYPPMEVDINGDLQNQVRIIGKMIWSCREW